MTKLALQVPEWADDLVDLISMDEHYIGKLEYTGIYDKCIEISVDRDIEIRLYKWLDVKKEGDLHKSVILHIINSTPKIMDTFTWYNFKVSIYNITNQENVRSHLKYYLIQRKTNNKYLYFTLIFDPITKNSGLK